MEIMTFGIQETALEEIVLTSLSNRLRRSPFRYPERASQSESMILSKMSAWISFPTRMDSLSETRLRKFPTVRLKAADPSVTTIRIQRLSV